MTCYRCLGVGKVYKKRANGRHAVPCPACRGRKDHKLFVDEEVQVVVRPALPLEHYTEVDKALPGEEPRLASQTSEILRLFKKYRRLSNTTLPNVALRYSARLYDLRPAGYLIELVSRERATGVTWYELKDEP